MAVALQERAQKPRHLRLVLDDQHQRLSTAHHPSAASSGTFGGSPERGITTRKTAPPAGAILGLDRPAVAPPRCPDRWRARAPCPPRARRPPPGRTCRRCAPRPPPEDQGRDRAISTTTACSPEPFARTPRSRAGSGRRVLRRVLQEIEEDLPHEHPIDVDQRQIVRQEDRHLAPLERRASRCSAAPTTSSSGVHSFRTSSRARLEPRHVEQIADEPIQAARLVDDRLEQDARARRRADRLEQRARRARDRRERRAQIVRDGAQERVAQAASRSARSATAARLLARVGARSRAIAIWLAERVEQVCAARVLERGRLERRRAPSTPRPRARGMSGK